MNAAPARDRVERREQRLSVVPPARFHAARAPFVVVVVAILAAGLVGLLLLNTALAQGSFRMHDLQRNTAALQDREQQLQVAVDASNNPARLAAAAHHLGLVAARDPGFLRLSDGRILGAPHAASAPVKKHPATPSAGPSVTPSTQPPAGAKASPAPHTAPTTTRTAPRPTPTPSPAHGVHR